MGWYLTFCKVLQIYTFWATSLIVRSVHTIGLATEVSSISGYGCDSLICLQSIPGEVCGSSAHGCKEITFPLPWRPIYLAKGTWKLKFQDCSISAFLTAFTLLGLDLKNSILSNLSVSLRFIHCWEDIAAFACSWLINQFLSAALMLPFRSTRMLQLVLVE